MRPASIFRPGERPNQTYATLVECSLNSRGARCLTQDATTLSRYGCCTAQAFCPTRLQAAKEGARKRRLPSYYLAFLFRLWVYKIGNKEKDAIMAHVDTSILFVYLSITLSPVIQSPSHQSSVIRRLSWHWSHGILWSFHPIIADRERERRSTQLDPFCLPDWSGKHLDRRRRLQRCSSFWRQSHAC